MWAERPPRACAPDVFSRVVVVGCLAAIAGACGASASPRPPNGAAEVRVTATEFKMNPAEIKVAAGQPVRLTFVNEGVIEHDWEALGLKATNVQIVSSPSGLPRRAMELTRDNASRGIPHPIAGPGQQTVIEFTPSADGTFEVICTVPGHKEAGMVGMMVVGPGSPPTLAQAGTTNVSQTTSALSSQPATAPRLDQPLVAAPVGTRGPQTVTVDIEVKEVVAQLDDGITYPYWTFGGTVPGPMVRVRQGDSVEVTLRNPETNRVTHSIDLHAVTGPGGGAKVTQTAPGQHASFRFQALQPGVYVYHCASPPVPQHVANGMYGLIVVEPPEGLAPVDREFYVMQGDFYLEGARSAKGERPFAMDRMLDEHPEFVLFNGAVGSLVGERSLQARVGETVRIFFGVGGPNLTSSFHVIGEIFDRVHPEGSSEAVSNVQTTLVPAGGAALVEFKVDVPGDFILVDHSLGRLTKGAAAILHVEGPENASVFLPLSAPVASQPQEGIH